MKSVISKDGTTIAYDQIGEGCPLILVGGGFSYRKFPGLVELSELLSTSFSVINFDRRGRGDSGDTQPYSVQREIEDIEALIDAAGGEAYMWGLSSGAALALEAANQLGPKVRKLALYEAPFVVDDSRKPYPADYLAHMTELIKTERRGEAVKYFMKNVGVPRIFISIMPFMSAWAKLKEVAPTIVYDTSIVVEHLYGKPLPANKWSGVKIPTLVMSGSKSPRSMKNAMENLNGVLPNSTHQTIQGQTHIVNPKVHAPILKEFFDEQSDERVRAESRAGVAG